MSTAASTCGLCSALLLAAAAHGGPMTQWSLEQLAKAEVLAVARVESAGGSDGACTADLAVLRSFGEVPPHIRLSYECDRPRAGGIAGGPIFPRLERGQVRVFPLNRSGAAWKLFAREGLGLLMPALPQTANLAGTPLAYLVDELANNFFYGTYRQMSEAAEYARWQPSKLVLERIETDLPDGDARWLDIASVALAWLGTPRAPLSEAKGFAGAALGHVPEKRRRSGIVRNMIRHTDVHAWGSAATLVPEFQDDPLLLELLPGYLAKLHPGSLNLAWSLARSGQTAVLPISLDAATRTLDLPRAEVSDLYAASHLLVKHGSDAQFGRLLDALKAGRTTERYMQLWQVAYTEEGPRILRMVAVLLDDERPMSADTTMRYCDIAGGRLQGIAKTDFGFKQWDQDFRERRSAVARARDWLRVSIRR